MFKKLSLLTIIVTCLLPLCVQAQEKLNSYGIAGLAFNSKTHGKSIEIGLAKRMAENSRLWGIARVTAGPSAVALDPDVGYFVRKGNWRAGIIAAPGIDFVGIVDPLAYVTGSAGFSAGWIPYKKGGIGAMIAVKYCFDYKQNTRYVDGVKVNFMLAAGF